jgi:nicotinamide-nucleotide amidase
VPSELQGLCQEWLLPRVAARLRQVPVAGMVKLFGVPESHADHLMRPIMDDPDSAGVRFGYRAHWPEVHVKWTVAGPDAPARAERIRTRVRAVFGDQVFGEAKDELPQLAVSRLAARGERVALAESCTGGLLAQLLTDVPGASAVLDVGVVAYADGIKERLLGVEPALLAAHGAVSEPVARAMAEGARRLGVATWGVDITGIAGPSGGTPEKPVGTVHLALAGPARTEAVHRVYRGDRPRIRRQAAFEALNLLRLAMR